MIQPLYMYTSICLAETYIETTKYAGSCSEMYAISIYMTTT